MESKRKFEAVVGLFVIVSLAALFALTTKFGVFSFRSVNGYHIYAVINSAGGLKEKAKVVIAGITVGRVDSLALKGKKAEIGMIIDKGIRIPVDSAVKIKTAGAIGEHYLEIVSGESKQYLAEGGILTKQITAADLQNAFISIKEAADGLKKLTNAIDYKKINSAIVSFEKLAENTNRIILSNRNNVNEITGNLKILSRELKDKTPVILNRLAEFSKNLKEISGNNKESIKQTVASIKNAADKFAQTSELIDSMVKGIKSGKGTIGKLITDDSAYNNLTSTLKSVKKTFTRFDQIKVNVETEARMLSRDSDFKGYAGVKINTSPDRFYRIGVTAMRDYKESTTPSRRNDNKNRLTVQIGKRYDNFVIRGGITESTFGVGTDYYINNHLKITTDLYDFGKNNDIRDSHFHMNTGFSYKFYHYFYLTGGVEDLLNADARSPYAGFGITFSDEDLKYLAGQAPLKFK